MNEFTDVLRLISAELFGTLLKNKIFLSELDGASLLATIKGSIT